MRQGSGAVARQGSGAYLAEVGKVLGLGGFGEGGEVNSGLPRQPKLQAPHFRRELGHKLLGNVSVHENLLDRCATLCRPTIYCQSTLHRRTAAPSTVSHPSPPLHRRKHVTTLVTSLTRHLSLSL